MIANRICALLRLPVWILDEVVTQKNRKLEGLTQEKLAEKVDLNPVYLGQIERGYKVPTVDVLLRLAKVLKIRLRDIVHEL